MTNWHPRLLPHIAAHLPIRYRTILVAAMHGGTLTPEELRAVDEDAGLRAWIEKVTNAAVDVIMEGE